MCVYVCVYRYSVCVCAQQIFLYSPFCPSHQVCYHFGTEMHTKMYENRQNKI